MGRGKEIGLDTRDVGSNDGGVFQYLACTIKPRDLALGIAGLVANVVTWAIRMPSSLLMSCSGECTCGCPEHWE